MLNLKERASNGVKKSMKEHTVFLYAIHDPRKKDIIFSTLSEHLFVTMFNFLQIQHHEKDWGYYERRGYKVVKGTSIFLYYDKD